MNKSIRVVLLLLCLWPFTLPAGQIDPQTQLREWLDDFLATTGTPGAAIAVFGPRSAYVAASGFRRLGSTNELQVTDRLHLGSNIKAMTAWLAAYDVEQGRLRWSTRLEEVFPELSESMRPEYRSITIDQILRHRSGILPLEDSKSLGALPPLSGDPVTARAQFTAYALTQPQTFEPGTNYAYSNGGYAVMGAILERINGTRFETLLMDRLLRPIEADPSFEWPASGGAAAPWGHYWNGSGWEAVDPDAPENRFPPFLNPAGNLSLSITDYLRFVRLHLLGLQQRCALLQPGSYQALHTADPDSGFSGGWLEFDFGGQHASAHDGESGMFLVRTMILPGRDIGFAVMTNAANVGDANFDMALNILTARAMSLDAPDLFGSGFETCH